MDAPLHIGALAKQNGLDVQTIRWYERIGLLQPPRRGANGYRLYGDEDRERLRLIRQAKGIGLTLNEIKATLALLDEGCCESVRSDMDRLLDAKVAAIDARVAELQALRDELELHRGRLIHGSVDRGAEDSCTPGGCICLSEHETPQLVQIEVRRRILE